MYTATLIHDSQMLSQVVGLVAPVADLISESIYIQNSIYQFLIMFTLSSALRFFWGG